MENNNLNKRIKENVRNRVVISNIESEVNMNISKGKQILSVMAICIIMLGGSAITVNAATGGKLAEKVTETIRVIFKDKDGKEIEIDGAVKSESNNGTVEKYEYEDDGVKYDIEVNTDTLNDLDSKVKIELDESNEWITMEYDYIEE